MYMHYIYSYYSGRKFNLNFQLSWILWFLSSDPFICYSVVPCFIGTYFSQVLFEWCWLESILNNFPAFCSSFLELKDERIRMPLQCIRILLPSIRMPLQCIRILLPSIRMLLLASGYPIYNSSILAISCAILSLNRVHSLYSFHKHLLMLFVSYSEH